MRAMLDLCALHGRDRRRLVLAVVLAVGATGAAIALLSTSGYLISRAAQQPQVIALMVAIVAVRALGIARAGLRYAERLASHDLALRRLAQLRVRLFAHLAPRVPGQLSGRGRGDLLTRFVADVDTLADVYLRVLIPALVAAAVILAVGIAGALMLVPLGIALAIALTLDALVCVVAPRPRHGRRHASPSAAARRTDRTTDRERRRLRRTGAGRSLARRDRPARASWIGGSRRWRAPTRPARRSPPARTS